MTGATERIPMSEEVEDVEEAEDVAVEIETAASRRAARKLHRAVVLRRGPNHVLSPRDRSRNERGRRRVGPSQSAR